MKKLFASIILGSILMFSLALTAYAIEIPKPDYLPGPSEDVTSGFESQSYILNTTIPTAINISIGILGLAAFLGMVISSVQFLTAYGNEDKINRAKTNLRYSVFGFLLIIMSYAIISIIVSVALPQEDETSFLVPRAYAVSSSDLDVLFPDQETLIEEQGSEDDIDRGVSLPSGDFVTEILPAIITNLLYLVGFLVFIAFMYGGVLLVIGRGNEDMTTKAKNIIIYSAIALGIVMIGFAVIFGIATIDLEPEADESFEVFPDTLEE